MPESSIAVCLIVRHLENLDRQISHFMIQPYRNCHVFAAVKGMTEDNFSSLVLPRYEHWIRQGRGMSFLLIIPAIMLWC